MAFKMKGPSMYKKSALKHKVGNPPVYHKGYDWNIYPDKHTHDVKTGDEIKHFYKGKEKGKLYTHEEKKKEEEATKKGK